MALGRDKENEVIIKTNADVSEVEMQGEGIHNVTRQILIGPDDGVTDIIMRKFCLFPGGNTPYHLHAHEHIVKIEKGHGLVVDGDGRENPVCVGQSLLIEGGEKHRFKNPHDEPFEFLCIIKDPGKAS
jgi:quercetin dioxygenase-like cupin family protein